MRTTLVRRWKDVYKRQELKRSLMNGKSACRQRRVNQNHGIGPSLGQRVPCQINRRLCIAGADDAEPVSYTHLNPNDGRVVSNFIVQALKG